MNKLLVSAIALLCAAGPALAEDNIPGDFSTTIGFTSEYSFRGLAQSDEGPAVQGSIDWSHDSGFYAGIWGSNVEFTDASIETDIFGGYSGAFDGFTYDIGGIYYAYPGADDDLDYDFFETAFALGYDFEVATLSGALNYSPDFFASSGDAVYAAGYLDVPLSFLPYEMTLNTSVGHQWIDDNAAYGVDDYTDWGIGLSANVEGFDLSLKYIDTSLDEPSECADGCDQRVIFAVSKTLP